MCIFFCFNFFSVLQAAQFCLMLCLKLCLNLLILALFCTIAIMKFPNNVIGKVFVSTGCKRNYTMRSVFYGTKGTIITDNTSNHMTVFKDGVGNGETLFADLPQSHAIPIEYPVTVNNHNAAGELDEFVDCIVNDKPIHTTAIEGAKTVKASLAAVESSKTGMPVKIEYDF